MPRPEDLEPGVNTTPAAAAPDAAPAAAAAPSEPTSSAPTAATPPAQRATPSTAAAAAPPAAAPPAAATPAARKSTTAKSTAAKGPDRIELDTTDITGNRELPKVLYIVPWKRSDLGDIVGRPVNSLLDEVMQPLDRDVFQRENRYYDGLKPSQDAPKPGTAQGSENKP